jgi:type I restriction enzyme M protein
MTDTFKEIEKLEADLWEAADNLRANSKLTSSDYFMPVLGVIFLRHAANRFEAATHQIKADQVATSGSDLPRLVTESITYYQDECILLSFPYRDFSEYGC